MATETKKQQVIITRENLKKMGFLVTRYPLVSASEKELPY